MMRSRSLLKSIQAMYAEKLKPSYFSESSYCYAVTADSRGPMLTEAEDAGNLAEQYASLVARIARAYLDCTFMIICQKQS